MKTLCAIILAICFATTSSFAQEKLDIVRLKNGLSYKGTLVSAPNADTIKLRDTPTSILVFAKDEILNITSEYPEFVADSLSKFGGIFSIGWAMGGGGLLGVPLRLRIGQATAFEAGLLYRPFLIEYPENDFKIKGAWLVAGSINLGMKKKYNPIKRKIVANGAFIRGGTGISKYKESLFGVGWARERFQRYNKKASFVSELGPGLLIRHWVTDRTGLIGPFSSYNISEVGFVIMWKIHWNGYPGED